MRTIDVRRNRISRLIADLMHNPNQALSKNGDDSVVRSLAEIGALAVHPILAAMSGPYPTEQHPIDVVEALGAVLNQMARRDAEPLIKILEENSVSADPQMFFLVSALKYAHSKRAVEALISALKHPHKTVRKGAVLSLVDLRDKRIVAPLIDALNDRSSGVKFVIVEAMKNRDDLRDARALNSLKRITNSKTLQKNSPGLCRYATDLIRLIEDER
jgi:HEAT repeats